MSDAVTGKDITLRGADHKMTADFRVLAAVGALIMTLSGADAAFASKPGGVLTVYNWDNPPSLSIHEEITNATLVPMMGVYNNLIMYKQDEPQNSHQSIVPDLATGWSWSEDGTQLSFQLREGVRWHDGRPLPPKTFSAPGTCCSAGRMRSCAPTP